MQSNPLSLAEHRALGQELFHLRNRVQSLMIAIANRYPKSGKTSRTAITACRTLDTVRCRMDSQAAVDLGDEFTTQLYYPGTQAESSPITASPLPVRQDETDATLWAELTGIRVGINDLLGRLNNRVRARILDAALAVHRDLQMVALRIKDADGSVQSLGLPEREPLTSLHTALSDGERMEVAGTLRALRERYGKLADRIGRDYRRVKPVVKIANKTCRTFERLARVFEADRHA